VTLPPAAADPGYARGTAGVPDRCAPAALRRGDQRYGTAPPAPRWLLVEHPGPWEPHAFDANPALAAVAERANAAGVRAALIRRPGREPARRADAPRRYAYVDARPGREGVRWGTYLDEGDLLEAPLEAGPGERSRAPVYLVCTHGRHDACCAIWGRDVAAELAAARPGAVWECTHVGGDRFSANLVLLPHGLYYGHVTPRTAVEVTAAYEQGLVVPEWLRGRSAFAAPVQAAQHHLRLALAEYRVDALPPLGSGQVGERVWRVRLGTPRGPAEVTVRAERSAPARLTCGARREQSVWTYALVRLDPPGATLAG
jgi:hypothetical protein